ncbi:hypothetical protein SK141_0070 [Streptococcus oralis]|nr:hypothetical protein [Streptococcus oralis]KEQ48827.1 hypothetical protein SK141_0070 [Streptococcus oralis]
MNKRRQGFGRKFLPLEATLCDIVAQNAVAAKDVGLVLVWFIQALP